MERRAKVRLPDLFTVTIDTLAETHVLKRPLESKEAIDFFMDISKGSALVSSSVRRSPGGAPGDSVFTRCSYSDENFFVSWSSDGAERVRCESSFSRGMIFPDVGSFFEIEKTYLSRIDFCYDVECSLDFFRRFFAGPARWEKVDFRSGSIWRAEGKRFRIYDKAREQKLKRVNRWRMESSYASKRSVEYHTVWNGEGQIERPGRRAVLTNAIKAMENFKMGFSGIDVKPSNDDFKRYMAIVSPDEVEKFIRMTEGMKNGKRFARSLSQSVR